MPDRARRPRHPGTFALTKHCQAALIYGGGQERRLRSGTGNVALIAALGAVAELAARDLACGVEGETVEHALIDARMLPALGFWVLAERRDVP